MLRRIRDFSTRRVADGGEQGWTRWLIPALVLTVVLFAAAGVRDAYRDADAALARADRAQSAELSDEARDAQDTARSRSTIALGGGVLLAALLMWSFWARRSRVDAERRERRFQALLQNSSDQVLVVDADGTVRYATPVIERMLGLRGESVTGRRLLDLVVESDRVAVGASLRQAAAEPGRAAPAQWRASHGDGSHVPVESVCLDLTEDRAIRGLVVTIRDVGERKQLEERLHRRAFFDSLTDLPNRELFEDRVGHAFAKSIRTEQEIAVLFVDLDDFKTVNDSLGHAAGDELLRQTAARLYGCTRSADTAARLGGDEFAVLIEDVEDGTEVDAVATRIHAALDDPFVIQGAELFVHASIGIATSAEGTGCEELLRNADMAMYAAKAGGKGRSELFRPTMHLAARKRLQLKSDLRRAVEGGELRVLYQPLVNLQDGRILGAEALVRWEHPELGEIPPTDFIPLAEETGLIVPLGRRVLEEACRQARTWQDRLPAGQSLYVSVNLSVRQFRPAGQIAAHVREATAAAGLEASSLMLEITETVLMEDREAITRELQELKDLGARIAIDDFGTGYSALSYLSQFPIDTVKMDRSFVNELALGKGDTALVRSVVELGEALQMEIIAEGIEHRGQLDSLADLRCTVGQGFYFARPLEGGEVAELFAARSATTA